MLLTHIHTHADTQGLSCLCNFVNGGNKYNVISYKNQKKIRMYRIAIFKI